MATVGKLTQRGELKLSGNIDTRLPLVTDGLVAHFPMDGTTKGRSNRNKLNYSTWVVGSSGTQSGFSQNGDGNSIIEDIGPFGESQAIWRTLGNDATSNDDGGWNGSQFSISHTLTYRYSVWVRRPVQGNGSFYLGCQGGNVYNANHTGTTVNTNPYFTVVGSLPVVNGEWVLVVGHVLGSGDTSYVNHPESGYYKPFSTTKVASISSDYRWTTTATNSYHRTYLYYSTNSSTNQQWCYPRVDLCDGTEPTIEDLVNGEGNILNPSVNISTSSTDEYVAVEEARTNIITNTNLDSGWSKGYCTDILWNDIHPPLGIDSQVVSFIDSDGNGSGYWYCYGNYAPQDPSTTYTISVYARTFGNPVSIYAYTADNSEVGRQSTNGLSVPGNGEWVRLVFNSITTPSNTQSDSLSFNISSFPPNQRLWLCAPQMEVGNFATEFVDGFRGAPQLKYPVTLASESTISFDYYAKERISNTIISNSNFEGVWWGIYINGTGHIYMHEGHDGTSWNPSTYLIPINQWINITIKWTSTTQYLYVDGTYLGEVPTIGSTNSARIPLLSLGYGWNVGNAKFKNLSIYNRALTTEEIEKNIKGTHSISTNGLISNNGIKSHIKVPDGANYFPLDSDGRDFHKSIIPTKDEATEYIDGSVWIGVGTTNLVTPVAFNKIYGEYSGWESIGISNDVPRTYVFSVAIPVTPSANYAISIIYKNSLDILDDIYLSFNGTGYPEGNVYMRVFEEAQNPNPIIVEPLGGGFKRYSTYFTTTANTTAITSMFFDADVAGEVVFLGNPQIELGNFVTPFVNGTRGQSSLHLPYNIIDCKQDFTIYGWWYPKTMTGPSYRPCLCRNIPDSNDTYDRILIMNSAPYVQTLALWFSSNSVSQGYFEINNNTIVLDEWNFFCVKRDGVNIHLFLGNSNGITSNSSGVLTHLDTDETGQVWQVGEYANGESDAYHRDYVFYQGALTNDEIEDIFKTKMKATSDGLYIQNGISSNESL